MYPSYNDKSPFNLAPLYSSDSKVGLIAFPTPRKTVEKKSLSVGYKSDGVSSPHFTDERLQNHNRVTINVDAEANKQFKYGRFASSDPEKKQFTAVENSIKEKDKLSKARPKRVLPKLNLSNMAEHQVQAPLFNERLSFLSPRIEDKRQSDLNSIFADSNELKGLQGLKLIEDSNPSIKFDNKLNEYLQKSWILALKTSNGENRSSLSENIIKSYKVFIAKEIDALYTLDKLEFKDFLIHESPRVSQLLKLIQKGGVPFEKIFPRIRLLRSLIDAYLNKMGHKTAYSIKLYNYLDRFLEKQIFPIENNNGTLDLNNLNYSIDDVQKVEFKIPSGKEIQNFLSIYDELMNLTSDKKEFSKVMVQSLKRWAIAPLGESEIEREAVIKILRVWGGHTEVEKARLIENLKTDTWDVSRTSYYITHISTIFHRWVQCKDLCTNSLANIKCSQIYEHWKQVTVIYDIVKINGRTFWDYRSMKLCTSPGRTEIEMARLFDNLDFNRVQSSQALSYQRSNFTVKQILENMFMMFSGKEAIDKDVKKQSAEFVCAANNRSYCTTDLEIKIPWIPLMRLATDPAWEEADLYMKKLYQELFMDPYIVKYDGRSECHINVEHREVTQIKGISVYLQSDPNNPNSAPKEQVNLSMAWRLKPIKLGWKGVLWIERYEIMDDDHWLELRSKLIKTVDVNTLPGKPKGIQYFSDQPSALYTKKHVSIKKRSTSLNHSTVEI